MECPTYWAGILDGKHALFAGRQVLSSAKRVEDNSRKNVDAKFNSEYLFKSLCTAALNYGVFSLHSTVVIEEQIRIACGYFQRSWTECYLQIINFKHHLHIDLSYIL